MSLGTREAILRNLRLHEIERLARHRRRYITGYLEDDANPTIRTAEIAILKAERGLHDAYK